MGLESNDLQIKEEKQLIKRALSGENLAWKQILIRYKRVIIKAIKSHLFKFNEAYDEFKSEDIYQEVLLKLHKAALAQYLENDSGAKLSSFIYIVAINTAKDYTKSKLGQASLKEINPNVKNDNEDNESLETFIFIDETKCSEMIYEKEEEREILRTELIELEFESRRVVEMYLSGETNKDIACMTNIQEASVNKVIFNFKKKLEKKYKKVS